MLTGNLHEVGDRGAKGGGEFAERRNRGIRVAVLDLNEGALADTRERGQTVERQPAVATASSTMRFTVVVMEVASAMLPRKPPEEATTRA